MRPLLACVAVSLLQWAVPAARAADDPGRVGFGFLRLGAGARVDALGSVGSTLANGAEALTWNPSLLAHAHRFAASASAMTWLDETTSAHAALTKGFGKLGVGGVAIQALSVSDFSNVPGQTEDGQSDVAISAGLAHPVLERLDAGIVATALRSSLAGTAATGAALDAGLNYRYVDGWNVGAVVRDFGPGIGYDGSGEDQLPTQFAAGIGGTVRRLRFGAELAWENGRAYDGGLGAELELFHRLALRAGTRLGSDADDAVNPWTAGVGVNVARGLAVDYAYRDGVLDPSHRVALRWGADGSSSTAQNPQALSAKEFYLGSLDEALDRALANAPRDVVDTLGIRAKTAGQTDTLVVDALTRRLQAMGYKTVELKAPLTIPASLDSATAAKVAEATKSEEATTTRNVVMEYEIHSSRVSIDRKYRERLIGPLVLDRSADSDISLLLLKEGETEPLWSSRGQSRRTETVPAKSVPPNAGFPVMDPEGVGSGGLHPLVEPAIVGGIVTGSR